MEGYFDSFAILAAFTVGVFVLLLIDLVVLSGKDHHVGMREATLLTIFWTLVAAAVGIWVFIAGGNELGIEYATAYVAERALSIDNLFVFLVIFNYFALPDLFRSRALLFGIVGALIARAVFIFFAIGIIDLFEPILYLLAAILIYTAYKLITSHDEDVDPSKNILLRAFRKVYPVSDEYDGHNFFTNPSSCDATDQHAIGQDPQNMEIASPGQRFGAGILDAGLTVAVGIAAFVIGGFFGDDRWLATMLIIIAYIIFVISMITTRGQSPGKFALNLKIVRTDGRSLGLGGVLLREAVGKFVSGLFIYLGYIWIFLDDKRQGWHDKMAGTHVVALKKVAKLNKGIRMATPFALVVIVLASTDVVFAIDSIPTVVGISKNQFIIWSSNAMAVLGMRPLFFLLEGLVNIFRYLSYGLAAILAFIGVKIIVETAIHDQFHNFIHDIGVPGDSVSITITLGSLAIVIAILVISVIASVVLPKSEEDHHSRDEAAA